MALTPPPVLVEAFAVSGDRNVIPIEADPTPGLASYDLGFPPATMTPIVDGGIPPRGKDMNGILFDISSHIAWLNAGGAYAWSSDIADFDGYPDTAIVRSNVNAWRLFYNTVDGNTNDPDVDPTGWTPFAHPSVCQSTQIFTNTLPLGSTGILSILPQDSILDLSVNVGGSQLVSVAGVDGQVIQITNLTGGVLTLMAVGGGPNPEFNFRLPTDIDLPQYASMSFKYSENAERGESAFGCWIPL